MDWESHRLLGKYLCEHFSFPQEYVGWSIAPDIDAKVMHRYWRHRFSTFKELYEEYPKVTEVPTEDKIAIGVMLCSHLLLDIYTAPIFCFGFYFPASHIPPEFIKELLEEEKYPKYELLKSEEEIFKEKLKPESASAFMGGVIELLASYAPFVPHQRVNEARRAVEEFANVSLSQIYSLREFDAAFYNMLNEFFARY